MCWSVLSEQHDAPGGLVTTNSRKGGSIDDAYFTGTYNTVKPWEHFWIDLYALVFIKMDTTTNPAYALPNTQVTTEDRLKTKGIILSRLEFELQIERIIIICLKGKL